MYLILCRPTVVTDNQQLSSRSRLPTLVPLITVSQASLAYGHVALLDHVDFQLEEKERIGLIGRNDGGKSTLLRVLAESAALDDGELWLAPGLHVALVPQEPKLETDATVFEQVARGVGPVRDPPLE